MLEKIIDNTTDRLRHLAEPVNKLNTLMVGTASRLVEFQLEAGRSYVDLGLQRMRELGEIRDIEGLTRFAGGQFEFASELARKFMDDLKALGELGGDFREEAREIFRNARQSETGSATVIEGEKAEAA